MTKEVSIKSGEVHVMHTSNDGDDLGLRLEITEKGKQEIELFIAAMN